MRNSFTDAPPLASGPPQTAIARVAWSEPEARALRASSAFSIRMQRLAGGPFSSSVSLLQTPLIRIGAERIEGAPMRVHGELDDGVVHACVAMGPDTLLDGVRLSRPSLHVHGAGALFDSTSRGQWWCGQVRIHGDAIEDPDDPLRAWFDARRRRHKAPSFDSQPLSELILTLTERVLQAPESMIALAQGVLADDLINALRSAVSVSQPNTARRERPGLTNRRRLVLAAEELVRHRLAAQESISIEALCRSLHTSERTLQVAFQEQLGISVRGFVLNSRLQNAHWLLLHAGDRLTLTDIATRAGLWHLGRSAHYYRRLFGCSPSEMQRRIWPSVGDRPPG